MKVQMQTSVTPVINIYDSTVKDTDSAIMKKLKSVLRPVVHVTDDSGIALFKTGEFYTPWLMYLGLGLIGLLTINYIQHLNFKKYKEHRSNRKRLKKVNKRR